MFLEGTKAELSKILNAEAIAKLGPLFDAAQMVGAIAEGSTDRVGEVATGIVSAEVLGGFGAFLGTLAARSVGGPGIVGAGLGAFAGAFIGNSASEKLFQEIFKPLAEAMPVSVWDKYFDLGLWAGDKIPLVVWEKLFGVFDYSRESVRALIDKVRQLFEDSKTIVSPIVLDLNGDGVDATSVAGGVYFDHDADRFAEKSGWVNASDGLLVLDRDGNGAVDSGRELFGSETLLLNGSKAPNGFAALTELDSNGDALVDARDSAFSTLRVWRDLDQDSATDTGELQTLADAGIVSLSTSHVNNVDADVHGNVTRQTGHFTRADGGTGDSADIWFAVDHANSVSMDQVPVSPDIAALPNIAGVGKLDSLHQAMAKDSTGHLKQVVQQFAAATDVVQRRSLFDQLLNEWAGVDGVAPDSRGYMPDARQLHVIEAFIGEGFIQGYGYNAGTPNTGWNAGEFLTRAYQELADGLYDQFLIQGPLKPLFDSIGVALDPLAGDLSWQVTGTVGAMRLMWESGRTADLNEFALVLKRDSRNGVGILEALQARGSASGDAFDAWLTTIGNFAFLGDALDNALTGTSGAEILTGKEGNDTLDGGAGNDLLQGDQGDDTYLFSVGSGQDSVLDLEGSADAIRFGAGIAPGDLSFARRDYDIVVSINGVADKITLRNWGGGANYRIERLEFADGTVWDQAQIDAQLANVPLVGSDGEDVLVAWAGQDSLLRGMGSNDQLFGFTGNDTLEGGAGNDQLVGGGGIDNLAGGEGNDKLFGDADQTPAAEHGNDLLDGGLGNDFLRGYGGDDALLAGDGDDTLVGEDGNDRLEGGEGADLLDGGAGADTLLGGEGNDQLDGGAGPDALAGGTGDDMYIVDSVADSVVEAGNEGDDGVFSTVSHALADNVERLQLDGAASIDGTGNALANMIIGNAGANTLSGHAGNDVLAGRGGADHLLGGDGDDELQGDPSSSALALSLHGNDVLDGGAGNDALFGGGGTDGLDGGEGNDTLYGDGGADVVMGGDGDDTLSGDNGVAVLAASEHGDDTVDGGAGNDTLFGGGGNDALVGGSGDDTLYGDDSALPLAQHGADTLDGGTGNDQLQGRGGNDVYVFARGYGNDSVFDQDATAGNADRIRLDGLNRQDVQLERESGTFNLLVRVLASNETLTVVNHFAVNEGGFAEHAIETIQFADGTTLTGAQIAQATLQQVNGTAADDTITGSSTGDVLRGLGGNDTISGGAGDDLLDGGPGDDVLYGGTGTNPGGGYDTFVFGRGSGQDTIIESPTDTDQDIIRLTGLLPHEVVFTYQGVDLLISIEGTSDRLRVQGYFSTSTGAVEAIVFADGQSFDKNAVTQRLITSTITGTANNDNLSGTTLNDRIDGGAGNDSIYAYGGNDIVTGGPGDDTLNGDTGNDTFVFARGDGRDMLYDGSEAIDGGSADRILFAAGIVPTDLVYSARADLPSSDPDYDAADRLNSDDVIVGLSGSSDRIVIDGLLRTNGSIESLAFADGAVVSRDQMLDQLRQTAGTSGDDALRGGSGVDVIAALEGNDVAHGFGGDDQIDGGAGADLLHGDQGNDLLFGGDGADTLRGGAGDDRLEGGAGYDYMYGEDGNDVLVADSDSAYMDGGAGDDVLDSGTGNVSSSSTTYTGGTGSDTFILRTGMGNVGISVADVPAAAVDVVQMPDFQLGDVRITQDSITLTIASVASPGDVLELSSLWESIDPYNKITEPSRVIDRVRFADGTELTIDQLIAASAVGTAAADRLRGTNANDTIDGYAGIDQLYGHLGDDALRGGDGDDLLFGMHGSDRLEGGAGNDTLEGGGDWTTSGDGTNTLIGGAGNDRDIGGLGDDIVVFGRGDGSDTIEDANGGTADTLQLGSGVLPQHVALYRDGSDLVVVIDGSATQARIKSFYALANRPIERIAFDGGSGVVWDVAQIEAAAISGTVNSMTGTAGDDVFEVDNALDTIAEAANGGVDEVRTSVTYSLPANVENVTATGLLHLTLYGNALDNVMRGNAGGNEFRASGGTDRAIGGAGDDTYHIEVVGSGQPAGATAEESPGEGFDTLRQLDGNWLYQYYDVYLPANVERLVLGRSSVRLLNGLGQAIPRGGIGNSGDNEIYGEPAWENELIGAGGRDLLVGGSAGDVYRVDSNDDVIADPVLDEYNRNGFAFEPSFDGVATVLGTGDVVFSTAPAYVLPERVENMRLEGTSAINGTGNGGRNVLFGNAANNQLDGGAGDDKVFDQWPQYPGSPYYSDDVDLLLGGVGNDTLTSHAGGDTLAGGDGNDTINAYGGGVLLDGGSGDDVISAATADSTLVGGAGSDTLNGSGRGSVIRFNLGDGDDAIVLPAGNADGRDRLVFGDNITPAAVSMERTGSGGNDLMLRVADGGGSVLVQSYFASSVPDGYRSSALASIEFANGTVWTRRTVDSYFGLPVDPEGTEGDDVLVGDAGRNVLYSYGGNDRVEGRAGSDDLFGGAGEDLLLGEDGNDALFGEAGNDILDGGAGDDTLVGGPGNDVYRGGDGLLTIIEAPGEGTDTLEVTAGGALHANVEIGVIVTAAGASLYGNELDNTLLGNSGADTLEGQAGADVLDGGAGVDTMLGGAGDDRYIVDNASDVTTENANEGTDTVESSVTRTLGSNQENLTLTGTAAINGTGNSLANVLAGNGANNTLDGKAGADTMSGGAGNDTYVVDNTGDVVIENANEGTDLVQSSVSYSLSANLENLTLTGSGGLSGTGNVLDNVLTGNSGANTLAGGDGNDTLDGGSGNDTMLGGAGNDTYVVNATGDAVTENANEGTDTVQSSVTYTLGNNVEHLTLTGSSGLSGTGNALDNVLTGNGANNTLTGNAGNDVLDGGSGSDTLRGGAGDDPYVVNVSADVVTENSNEGTDTVQSSVTLTLATNVEHLTLTGTSAINGTGNTLANHIRGNGAANTLNGSGGNDVLQGAAGNDTVTDTSGNNLLDGADGTDGLNGGTGREFVAGGAGTDTLKLGGGADIVGFNRGHGADSVTAPTSGAGLNETNDTVSVGGVRYADLRLARSGNDLFIKIAGSTDSLKFTGWYAASGNRTTTTLQLVVDSTADYNAGSADQLVNRRVVRLNFTTLVNAFNTVYAGNPSIGDWAIPSATLTSAYVAGSDTQALGGDLAYRYGRDGNFSALDFATATAVLGNANFATAAQSFNADPTTGGVRLLGVGVTGDDSMSTKRRQDEVLALAERWAADQSQSNSETSSPYLTVEALDSGWASFGDGDPWFRGRGGTVSKPETGNAADAQFIAEGGRAVAASVARQWLTIDAFMSRLEAGAMPALGGEAYEAGAPLDAEFGASMLAVPTAIKPRQPLRQPLY